MYKTTANTIGQKSPSVHTMPTQFYCRSQKFSQVSLFTFLIKFVLLLFEKSAVIHNFSLELVQYLLLGIMYFSRWRSSIFLTLFFTHKLIKILHETMAIQVFLIFKSHDVWIQQGYSGAAKSIVRIAQVFPQPVRTSGNFQEFTI